MKFNKKMLIATIGVGTALLLAGCGAQHHSRKATSVTNSPSTKVVSHKSHKHHNINHKKQLTTSTFSNQSSSSSNSNNKQKSITTTNHSYKNVSSTPKVVKSPVAHSTSQRNVPNTSGLPTVNLGDGVIGHEDRGAGQEYITFSLHNHNYTVHGNDVQPGAGALPKAQSIVHSVLG